MWNDWLTIGKFTIHGYGACIAIGLLMALWMSTVRAKKRNMSEDICYGIVFCAAIFGFLSAKIMFCIVEWKAFLQDPWACLSSSGFVVFGGITGGSLAVVIYCLIKKVNALDYLELVVPSVALAQAFGRLGCFMAGCCYGRPTDSPIGIAFSHSDFAPNGVKLIPTQLISSVGNLINMLLLLWIAKNTKKRGTVLACYIIFYSVGRFFVEMLRNDERGSVGSLSTSQFYGIFSLIVGLGIFIWAMTHKEKEVEAVAIEEEKKEDV